MGRSRRALLPALREPRYPWPWATLRDEYGTGPDGVPLPVVRDGVLALPRPAARPPRSTGAGTRWTVRERKVCPWGCSGGKGEVDVLGAERVRVPNVASTAALVRCAECQSISIAGMVTAFSKSDVPRKAESRTPLGRFEGSAWVPADLHVTPLTLELTTKRCRGQRPRGW